MSDLDAAVRAAASRELPRAELAAAIVARLTQLGAPPESLAAARRIAEPKSVVVVAGQQPVLLGGPGLVWAKAVDAIAIARSIEAKHGVPAVAVFWNASEDHDHAECGHVRMDLGGDVEMLSIPLPNDRRMLSHVPVPAEAGALLDILRAKFPPGASRDEVLAALGPAADDAMGSWFSRILLRLLGRHGLVVVEPQTLRRFASQVVEFELTRPGELAASVRRAEDEAASRGEPRGLELARDELLFVVGAAGRRLRVTREGDAWHVEDGRSLSTAQMRALPSAAFSWNVAARVLAQDVALPVVVQVCGPSEIRYCRRLEAAHALLGAPAPLLAARTTWSFEPARVRRLERELGVSWAEIAAGTSAGPQPGPAPQEPEAVRRLREIVASLPSSGSAAVQRRRSALVHGVDAYADALRGDADERDKVRAERLRRLLAVMRPEGEDQDRRLSPLPWFAANGLARLDDAVRTREDPPFITAPGYFTRRPERYLIESPNRGTET
jgi:uncharacterized protein YllA (UPF0747 family)